VWAPLHPQTEEIGLKIITTAKFSNNFSHESPYISHAFSGESPKFQTLFHVSRWSPRQSKETADFCVYLEIQRFSVSSVISSVSGLGQDCIAVLQLIATHCNTLQHTATYCNKQHLGDMCITVLQHTTTHYNILQHTATYCNILQQTACR